MFFLELGRINTQQLISSRILHLWGHLQFVENAKKSHLGKGGGFIWRKVKITQSLCLPALQVIRDQLLPVGKSSRADSSAPAKASLPGVLNHQDVSHWPFLLSALISDFLGNFLSRQTQIRLEWAIKRQEELHVSTPPWATLCHLSILQHRGHPYLKEENMKITQDWKSSRVKEDRVTPAEPLPLAVPQGLLFQQTWVPQAPAADSPCGHQAQQECWAGISVITKSFLSLGGTSPP